MTATPLEVAEADPGLGERVAHDAVEQLGVAPRGDLGDDAAELGVELVLRRDDRRQDLAAAHDGGAGVVARGLDAEQQAAPVGLRSRAHAVAPSQSFHMISASSRLSL